MWTRILNPGKKEKMVPSEMAGKYKMNDPEEGEEENMNNYNCVTNLLFRTSLHCIVVITCIFLFNK